MGGAVVSSGRGAIDVTGADDASTSSFTVGATLPSIVGATLGANRGVGSSVGEVVGRKIKWVGSSHVKVARLQM